MRAAIVNSGLRFPGQRVTVNLAPAAIRKTGSIYDLPIAVAILTATEQIPSAALEAALIVGELPLDGSTRQVSGVLPMAAMARPEEFSVFYVSSVDAPEAALLPGLTVIPVERLVDLVHHFNGLTTLSPHTNSVDLQDEPDTGADFTYVKGQEHVKRALEVAAA